MSLQHPLGLSCTTCRSRKRRCDKRLPKCSLCTRKDLHCSYTSSTSSRHRRNPDLLQHQAAFQQRASTASPESLSPTIAIAKQIPALELLRQTTFSPNALFLDSSISRHYHVDIPYITHSLPTYVSLAIGDLSHWYSIAKTFFETVHLWMPIISKKRFYEHVNPLCRLHSDYALLILCMDLTTWIPGSQIEDPRTPNYLAAKRYYLELEISGLLSIQALQSGILIAVFEFGHAIYPSALHSVASCISYGSSLGLDWRTASSSGSTQSWLDTEEKIRIFWAIVLLDRVMNIGQPERPLLIPDLELTVLLPRSDVEWDQGILTQKPRYSAATPTIEWGDMGPFALIAQAARLLGQVLRHVTESALDEEEAILLDKTLQALGQVVTMEGQLQKLNMMNQDAICSIALLLLHEAHASLPDQTKTSTYFESIHHAKVTISDIKESIAAKPKNVDQKPLASCVKDTSPFMVPGLYLSAITVQRLNRKMHTRESYETVELFDMVIGRYGTRWKSASSYLKVLAARDVLYMR